MTEVAETLHGLDFDEFTDLCDAFFVQSRKDLREMFNKLVSLSEGEGGVCGPQLKTNCKSLTTFPRMTKAVQCEAGVEPWFVPHFPSFLL